jgi:uncharacterized RDD family membrane protein YckC
VNQKGAKMKNIVTIQTPEYVQVPFETAGIVSRGIAKLVDFLVLSVILVPSSLISFAFLAMGDDPQNTELSILAALFFFITAALPLLYFVCLEYWMNGQTIGKKVLGLRVIHDRGGKASFSAVFLRNLLQLADLFPGFYVSGMIAIFLHREEKRIGDMIAGTLVVMEREKHQVLHFQASPLFLNEREVEILQRLSPISPEQYLMLESFLRRRNELLSQVRSSIAEQLIKKWWPEIETKAGCEEEFLEKVYLYLRKNIYPVHLPKIIPALIIGK